MNSLEKKSFYSFLSLYIISSTLFILLSGYWYYTAQKSALESNDYYKLQHIADSWSQKIIASHMRSEDIPLIKDDKFLHISLIDTEGKTVHGKIQGDFSIQEDGYFQKEGFSSLVSSSPQEHHNIRYIIVQSSQLYFDLLDLKLSVILVMSAVIVLMMILAWVLSKLFMRPLHQKIKQIEDFVHDTAHELNTPVTALNMSVSRALKKQSYDEKILTNISISTKQLFDIYTALSYLSFEAEKVQEAPSNIKEVLEKSVAYYRELAHSKKIELVLEAEAYEVKMDETKLSMLFGNLINNAIKYSHPHSSIQISFKEGKFEICDEGIGIDEQRLEKIFEKYNRETEYAGGFGVGLSIVKKICQEYDLGLEVDSKEGEGSCFSLSFYAQRHS